MLVYLVSRQDLRSRGAIDEEYDFAWPNSTDHTFNQFFCFDLVNYVFPDSSKVRVTAKFQSNKGISPENLYCVSCAMVESVLTKSHGTWHMTPTG